MRDRPDVLDWLAGRDQMRVAYRRPRSTHALGYAAASVYVETFWLPLVGPTALLALRRLDAWLANAPGEITISVADIDLIYLGLQVILTSIEKAREIAASSSPKGVRNGAVTEADDGFR